MPNPNNYPVINHIDGNKLNNSLDNLEWCTYKHNIVHSFKKGLNEPRIGVDNRMSKLSEEDIIYIREKYIPRHKHFGQRALANKFNVDHKVIYKILKNISYKNV